MAERLQSGKKRLVIFDLDGVLLDSKRNMEHAWDTATSGLGVTASFSDYFQEIGRPFPEIMSRMGLSGHCETIEAKFRIASMERLDLLRFYPSVTETLQKLSTLKVKLGVVTSKDILRTSAILAMLPVQFTCIQAPDPRFRGKPAPDSLLMAMAQANTDPSESVYVGDMETDCEAAERAGIDYIHATWGYGKSPARCYGEIECVTRLLELFE
jgi:phosphoglycolate phosphatase